MNVDVIILAAGSSFRMDGIDKILTKLPNGLEVIINSICKFDNIKFVNSITVVTREGIIEKIKKIVSSHNFNNDVYVIKGGKTRTQSLFLGYSFIKNKFGFNKGSYVLIHDGARPLIDEKSILNCLKDVLNFEAVAVGLKINDTVKRLNDKKLVVETIDRNNLFYIQTPQVFKMDILDKAIDNAKSKNLDFTDDCQLIEAIGKEVYISEGNISNIKITTQQDLQLINRGGQLNVKIGHGYDAHRLVEKRDFILFGVKINYCKGFLGHSDGDVGIHAIIDSLLGAIGKGDIGKHFPDNDEKYKDIDSKILLQKVVTIVNNNGYNIGNIDCTVILQEPKIGTYIPKMKEVISQILGIECDKINIKATTEENMGFTGKGLGAVCHAVALLVKG